MIGVDRSWRAFHGVHGGLVVAWLLEAASERVEHRPVAVTAHFLRGVDAAPGVVDAEVLHGGRTTSSVAVRLEQDDRVRAHALVSAGQPGTMALWSPVSDLSGVPAPEAIERFLLPPDFVPFGQHVDIRPVGGVLPGSGGDQPVYEAWIRLRDPGVVEALGPWGAAAVLLDAMPPGLLGVWTAPRAVPTVELTAHFAPAVETASPWWHITHRTVWAGEMSCVDETELRLPDGTLAAQARQARRIA